MKKLLFAWIEQVFSFDSQDERESYIENQRAQAERKGQEDIRIVGLWQADDGRFVLRLRKPYNNNKMIDD